MIELVVPDPLKEASALSDDRLSLTREMVGRWIYAFEGPLEDGQALATELSAAASGGAPVLLNDVTARTDETRTVDVYMHRDGQLMSVSEGIEKPVPET